MLGGALGLHYPKLKRMNDLPSDMVAAWLQSEDGVQTTSGRPSWDSLSKALREIGQAGIAETIERENTEIQSACKTSQCTFLIVCLYIHVCLRVCVHASCCVCVQVVVCGFKSVCVHVNFRVYLFACACVCMLGCVCVDQFMYLHALRICQSILTQ